MPYSCRKHSAKQVRYEQSYEHKLKEIVVHFLTDQGPERPPEQTLMNTKQHPSVAGNERIIALTGTVLLLLILLELVITVKLRALLSIHIFVGVLLTFPLFVKIGSTGYRFLSYYTGIPAFVRKGPPRPVMRLLAPFLLIASLGLMSSGILLTLLGPGHPLSVWVLRLHALSVICWLPLLAIHVGAYIWRLPRQISADWRKHAHRFVPGRGWRYGINSMALLAGVGAALLLLPYTASWIAWEPNIGSRIPGPLLAALFLAVLAGLGGLVVLKPWRWRQ